MHTRIDLMLCGRPEEECNGMVRLLMNKIRDLEEIGNYFNPSSELSLLNRQACGTPFKASEMLFQAVWESLDYGKQTNGCFDVTIDSPNYDRDMPQSVRMDIANATITFDRPDIRINLSGFLKGYALEVVRTILERFHLKDALINIGNSSVLALGNHPQTEGWQVGVELNGQMLKEVTLVNECLTTSGNDHAGRKHIRSPYTGEYVEGVRGVSVITRLATEGEALSTALLVASPQQREEILNYFPAAVVYDL